MESSRMLRHMAVVRSDISEELSAYIIRVTRISELGTLALTSNRRTLQRSTKCTKCIQSVLLVIPFYNHYWNNSKEED
jgi:hypothetical protein